MEKINIAELLKDCQKGMELDCTMFEGIEFDGIIDNEYLPIRCRIKNPNGGYNVYFFTKHGYWNDDCKAKCVIFPKGKTSWEGFQRPFKDGDIIFTHANCLKVGLGNTWISIFQEKRNGGVATYVDYAEDGGDFYAYEDKGLLCMNEDIMRQRLATEEEKEKLFQAIKEKGYKWNPETKTLEKLNESKFKNGDILYCDANDDGEDKDMFKYIFIFDKIVDVDGTQFYYSHCHLFGSEFYTTETNLVNDYPVRFATEEEKAKLFQAIKDNGYKWNAETKTLEKLPPNKFDITTLVPFESKVLVRNDEGQYWIPAFWGCKRADGYTTTFGWCKYCVPFEGNEHLLETNNDCNEFYKTWK